MLDRIGARCHAVLGAPLCPHGGQTSKVAPTSLRLATYLAVDDILLKYSAFLERRHVHSVVAQSLHTHRFTAGRVPRAALPLRTARARPAGAVDHLGGLARRSRAGRRRPRPPARG